MKVFLVIRGCYSDQYVAGAFSTRELAEADIALHGPDDTWNRAGEVQEYEIDESVGEVERRAYMVEIDLTTGEIFGTSEHPWFAQPSERGRQGDIRDFRRQSTNSIVKAFGRISQEITSYESLEHACKLAAEARQAWQRKNPGGEPTISQSP